MLLLPSLLLIGIFSYHPAACSLIGGFYQWTGFAPPSYARTSRWRVLRLVLALAPRGADWHA